MKQYRISMPDDRGVKYESFRYPGGEIQVRLKESELPALYEARELYVTAKITNADIMELAMLTDALKANGKNLMFSTLYLPYLPYGRADRRFMPGDCFGLRTFAKMLSTLGYNRIQTLDAHSNISNNFGIGNASPQLQILEAAGAVKYRTSKPQITYILPDEGAHRYGLAPAIDFVIQAEKTRDAKTGKLSGFSVPFIQTPIALIIDDICDGGGTFVGLARKIYEQQPDVELYLYVSHAILSKGIEELSWYFEKIYTANCFAVNPELVYGNFVQVL